MSHKVIEDILTILESFYKIPGEYFIAGLFLLYIWQAMKDWNPYAWIALLVSIAFFIIEAAAPFAAGRRLIMKLISIVKQIIRTLKQYLLN